MLTCLASDPWPLKYRLLLVPNEPSLIVSLVPGRLVRSSAETSETPYIVEARFELPVRDKAEINGRHLKQQNND